MAFVITAITAEIVTLATVALAVSELGIALTVVGAVTGNKDLMKIGGFLGLAGGIGSLASGALGAAEGMAAESAASGAAEGASEAVASSVAEPVAAVSQLDAAPSLLDGINPDVAFPTGVESAAPISSGINPDAAFPTGIESTPVQAMPNGVNPDAAYPNGMDVTAPQGATSPNGVTSPSAPSAPSTPADATTPGGGSATKNALYGDQGYGAASTPNGSSVGAIKDWWGKQSDTMKAAYLKGGASAVGGLMDGWTAEQKLALEQSRLDLEQQRFSNTSAIPTIRYQHPAGIINTARGI